MRVRACVRACVCPCVCPRRDAGTSRLLPGARGRGAAPAGAHLQREQQQRWRRHHHHNHHCCPAEVAASQRGPDRHRHHSGPGGHHFGGAFLRRVGTHTVCVVGEGRGAAAGALRRPLLRLRRVCAGRASGGRRGTRAGVCVPPPPLSARPAHRPPAKWVDALSTHVCAVLFCAGAGLRFNAAPHHLLRYVPRRGGCIRPRVQPPLAPKALCAGMCRAPCLPACWRQPHHWRRVPPRPHPSPCSFSPGNYYNGDDFTDFTVHSIPQDNKPHT